MPPPRAQLACATMGASTSKPKAEDDVDAIPTPAIKPPSVEYLERYKTTIYRQRSGLEGLGPIVQLMRVRNVPSSEAGFEPTTQVRCVPAPAPARPSRSRRPVTPSARVTARRAPRG